MSYLIRMKKLFAVLMLVSLTICVSYAQDLGKVFYYLEGEDENLSVKIDLTDWVWPDKDSKNSDVMMEKILKSIPVTLKNKGNANIDFSYGKEYLYIYGNENEFACEYDLRKKCQNYPDKLAKNMSKNFLILSNYTMGDILWAASGIGGSNSFQQQAQLQKVPDWLFEALYANFQQQLATDGKKIEKDKISEKFNELYENKEKREGLKNMFYGTYVYSVYEKEIPLYLHIVIK